MPRELARALADGLAAAGVRRVFGVPGGGPNLDVIGAAEDLGIEFVLTHGETAACVMAATFGRATGTPGVAVVTRRPGADRRGPPPGRRRRRGRRRARRRGAGGAGRVRRPGAGQLRGEGHRAG